MKRKNLAGFALVLAGLVLSWMLGCATTTTTALTDTPNGVSSSIVVKGPLNTTAHTEIKTTPAYDDCMKTNQNLPFPDAYCRSATSGGAVAVLGGLPGMFMQGVTFNPTSYGAAITQQQMVPGTLLVPATPQAGPTSDVSKEDIEDAVAAAREARKLKCDLLKAQGKPCSKGKK